MQWCCGCCGEDDITIFLFQNGKPNNKPCLKHFPSEGHKKQWANDKILCRIRKAKCKDQFVLYHTCGCDVKSERELINFGAYVCVPISNRFEAGDYIATYKKYSKALKRNRIQLPECKTKKVIECDEPPRSKCCVIPPKVCCDVIPDKVKCCSCGGSTTTYRRRSKNRKKHRVNPVPCVGHYPKPRCSEATACSNGDYGCGEKTIYTIFAREENPEANPDVRINTEVLDDNRIVIKILTTDNGKTKSTPCTCCEDECLNEGAVDYLPTIRKRTSNYCTSPVSSVTFAHRNTDHELCDTDQEKDCCQEKDNGCGCACGPCCPGGNDYGCGCGSPKPADDMCCKSPTLHLSNSSSEYLEPCCCRNLPIQRGRLMERTRYQRRSKCASPCCGSPCDVSPGEVSPSSASPCRTPCLTSKCFNKNPFRKSYPCKSPCESPCGLRKCKKKKDKRSACSKRRHCKNPCPAEECCTKRNYFKRFKQRGLFRTNKRKKCVTPATRPSIATSSILRLCRWREKRRRARKACCEQSEIHIERNVQCQREGCRNYDGSCGCRTPKPIPCSCVGETPVPTPRKMDAFAESCGCQCYMEGVPIIKPKCSKCRGKLYTRGGGCGRMVKRYSQNKDCCRDCNIEERNSCPCRVKRCDCNTPNYSGMRIRGAGHSVSKMGSFGSRPRSAGRSPDIRYYGNPPPELRKIARIESPTIHDNVQTLFNANNRSRNPFEKKIVCNINDEKRPSKMDSTATKGQHIKNVVIHCLPDENNKFTSRMQTDNRYSNYVSPGSLPMDNRYINQGPIIDNRFVNPSTTIDNRFINSAPPPAENRYPNNPQIDRYINSTQPDNRFAPNPQPDKRYTTNQQADSQYSNPPFHKYDNKRSHEIPLANGYKCVVEFNYD